MSFIHLHTHSEYSLVDGLIKIDDLISHCVLHNMSSVAITDHCNLFSMVKFYQAATEAGIKPIIGADVLIQNEHNQKDPHLLLFLCQNEQGYRNLTELVSRSYIEGQNLGRPIIQKSWLRTHQKGLIAIANCHESELSEAILTGNEEWAETCIEYWSALFPNRFYLEVTKTLKSDENTLLQSIVSLAQKKGCPLVATNDVRFLNREDFEAHEARVCIHQGITLNDPSATRKYTEEQYLKTPEEMFQLFSEIPESIENSVEIAKRCNLEIKLGQVFLPNYPVPQGSTVEDVLSLAAKQGLHKCLSNKSDVPPEYENRLELELNVINSMGFAGYFLIVADFIRWAKENEVPVGPGRGSGAGSLVAYALEITGLDPIQYDLLFERFLNPERVSMPDFDIDFCMEGRDRVIEYVSNTYGREAVSQIITFGTMAAKAVIRDVGRVLGHPYGFVDKIAKLIPMELGITLEKALKEEEILKKRYAEEEEVKNLIDLAKKLEGVPRNAGKHAGGVVIAPSKLTDFTPLYCDANEGVLLTQFDKNDVETIGLVKFDFLGLRTLTIIDRAMKLVNEARLQKNETIIDINSALMNDEATFDLLRSCHTTAVFQLESRGMKDLVRRLQPDNFEEIVALVALFRPGPLQSGMVDDFINRKHDRQTPEYLHPKLTHILKPTYGIILYQEQVMQIAQILAGYTLGAADLLRRAMGKKKPEEMAKQRAIFIKGAIERDVPEKTASTIFDLMEKFAGYGFNKSHSAGYSVLTYQTAWLKTHYPAYFMAAVLSCDMAHTDKIVIFIEEVKRMKIVLHAPSINESDYRFTVKNDNEILYGLGAIKGVGEAAIGCILEARHERPFIDLFDLCARVDGRKVSRRVLEALIRSGSLDCLAKHRAALMEALTPAMQASDQLHKNKIENQVDLFGSTLSMQDINHTGLNTKIPEWSKEQILTGEKETLGFYFSGHPLEKFARDLSQFTSGAIRDLRLDRNKKCTIAGIVSSVRAIQTKRGDRMAFLAIDDQTGRQDIAIFSDLYQAKRDLLVKDQLVIVEGELSIDDYSGGYKMRATSIMELDEARAKAAKYLKIIVEEKELEPDFSEYLSKVLKPYQGSGCFVQIHYQKENLEKNEKIKGIVRLGQNFRIRLQQNLLDELKELQGVIEVEVCY